MTTLDIKNKLTSVWSDALFVPYWFGLIAMIGFTLGLHLLLTIHKEGITLQQVAAPCSVINIVATDERILASATCSGRDVVIRSPDVVVKIIRGNIKNVVCDLYQDNTVTNCVILQ